MAVALGQEGKSVYHSTMQQDKTQSIEYFVAPATIGGNTSISTPYPKRASPLGRLLVPDGP